MLGTVPCHPMAEQVAVDVEFTHAGIKVAGIRRITNYLGFLAIIKAYD